MQETFEASSATCPGFAGDWVWHGAAGGHSLISRCPPRFLPSAQHRKFGRLQCCPCSSSQPCAPELHPSCSHVECPVLSPSSWSALQGCDFGQGPRAGHREPPRGHCPVHQPVSTLILGSPRLSPRWKARAEDLRSSCGAQKPSSSVDPGPRTGLGHSPVMSPPLHTARIPACLPL